MQIIPYLAYPLLMCPLAASLIGNFIDYQIPPGIDFAAVFLPFLLFCCYAVYLGAIQKITYRQRNILLLITNLTWAILPLVCAIFFYIAEPYGYGRLVFLFSLYTTPMAAITFLVTFLSAKLIEKKRAGQ